MYEQIYFSKKVTQNINKKKLLWGDHLSTDFKDVRKNFLYVQAVKYLHFIIFYLTEKW